MTEHFTREEAETWEALQIADKGRKPVAVYMQAEIDALRATTAKLKGWDAQGAVAWQCKEVGGTFWQDCSKERALVRAANPSKWEVRELYTHALPAQPAEPAKDVGVLADAYARLNAQTTAPGAGDARQALLDALEALEALGLEVEQWKVDFNEVLIERDQACAELAAIRATEDKWEGAEGWEPLAWQLCAEENGEDACSELIWEGGPIPEPWGDRWLKYEDEAKRLIKLVREYASPAAKDAVSAEPVNAELVKALKKLLEQYDELAEEDNSGWILAGELAKANHAREVLSRAQAAPVVGAHDACVWTQDTDYETDVHYSACGEAWSFIEGGPKENKVRFCQGCGKPVKLTYQPKIGGV